MVIFDPSSTWVLERCSDSSLSSSGEMAKRVTRGQNQPSNLALQPSVQNWCNRVVLAVGRIITPLRRAASVTKRPPSRGFLAGDGDRLSCLDGGERPRAPLSQRTQITMSASAQVATLTSPSAPLRRRGNTRLRTPRVDPRLQARPSPRSGVDISAPVRREGRRCRRRRVHDLVERRVPRQRALTYGAGRSENRKTSTRCFERKVEGRCGKQCVIRSSTPPCSGMKTNRPFTPATRFSRDSTGRRKCQANEAGPARTRDRSRRTESSAHPRSS